MAIASHNSDFENPIEFEFKASFAVDEDKLMSSQGVFQVDLCMGHKIFITSQCHGVVKIFNISDCELIGILNQGEALTKRIRAKYGDGSD